MNARPVLGLSLLLSLAAIASAEELDLEEEREEITALVETHRMDEAMPRLEKLRAAHPDVGWIYYELGFARLGLASGMQEAEARGEAMAGAREALLRARELDYQSPLLEPLLAQTVNQSALSKNPEAEKAMRAGEAEFQRGQMDEAIMHYQRALELEPKLYEAALFLGDAYFKSERLEEADKWFARALEIDPGREQAHRYWGDSLVRQGRIADAREKFLDAILAEPRAKLAWLGLRQWARATSVRVGHPEIDLPEVALTTEAGKTDVKISENALADEQTGAITLAYARRRAHYRDEQIKDGEPVRRSLAEEAAGLRAAIAVGRDAPLVENLRLLEKEGLLEAWILLVRADGEILRDYPAYRAAQAGELRRYLTDWFLAPERKR